ncbi:MAG TPA: DUF167 domain-containing protein [Thermoplasmata archaeon]
MTSRECVVPAEDGSILIVEVTAGAAETSLVGVNKWRGSIHIRVAAEPRKGEANDELIRFVSAWLSVPEKSISIVKGRKSSRKQVHVPVDPASIRRLLGGR